VPGLFDRQPFKPFKWAVTGVWYKEVVAQASGTVAVYQDAGAPGYFLVYVNGKKHKVPDDAFRRDVDTNPNIRRVGEAAQADALNRRRRQTHAGEARKGDVIWKGFETSGDQLFVNRIAWNFFPPKRDDVIVFATSRPELYFSEKEALNAAFEARLNNRFGMPPNMIAVPMLPFYFVDAAFSQPDPGQHYIKRLVGMPGETVHVEAPHVYAGGKKVEGVFGMDRVAAKEDGYDGYHNIWDEDLPYWESYANPGHFLRQPPIQIYGPDGTIALRKGDYLPMGDNTTSSSDGRYWGAVPRDYMLGPAAFVYWPVSPRWGRPVK